MSVTYTPPGHRHVVRVGAESNNWRAGPHDDSDTSSIQPIFRCADGTRIPLQQCGPSEFQVDEAYHIELKASTAGATVDSPVVPSEDSSGTLQDHSSISTESSLTSVEVEDEGTDEIASDIAVINHDQSSIRESELPDEQTPTVEQPSIPTSPPVEKVVVNKDSAGPTMATSRHAPQHAPSYMYSINYSDTEPDMSRKEYCAYWIRKGECDYTQQGCRFKHEMPDIATLRRIGFREYPAWWRQASRSMKLRLLNSWKAQANHATNEGSVLNAALTHTKTLNMMDGDAVRPRSNSICSRVTDLLIDISPLEPEPARSVLTSNGTNNGSKSGYQTASSAVPIPSRQPAVAAVNSSSDILSSSPAVQYLFRRPQPSNAPEIVQSDAQPSNIHEAEKPDLVRLTSGRDQSSKVSATPLPAPINASSQPTTRSLNKKPSNLNASPITAVSPVLEKGFNKTLAESKWANQDAPHPASVLAAAAGIKVDKVTLAPIGYPKPAVAKHASPLSQRRYKQSAGKSSKAKIKTEGAKKSTHKQKVEATGSKKVGVVIVKDIAA